MIKSSAECCQDANCRHHCSLAAHSRQCSQTSAGIWHRARPVGGALASEASDVGKAWASRLKACVAARSCFFHQHKHGKPHSTAPRHSTKHIINTNLTFHDTTPQTRMTPRTQTRAYPKWVLRILKSAQEPIFTAPEPWLILFFVERPANGRKHNLKMRRAILAKSMHFLQCAPSVRQEANP